MNASSSVSAWFVRFFLDCVYFAWIIPFVIDYGYFGWIVQFFLTVCILCMNFPFFHGSLCFLLSIPLFPWQWLLHSSVAVCVYFAWSSSLLCVIFVWIIPFCLGCVYYFLELCNSSWLSVACSNCSVSSLVVYISSICSLLPWLGICFAQMVPSSNILEVSGHLN